MGMMGMGGMDPAAMMSMMAPMGMATGKGGAFQPQKSQSAKTKQIGDYQGGLPAIGKVRACLACPTTPNGHIRHLAQPPRDVMHARATA